MIRSVRRLALLLPLPLLAGCGSVLGYEDDYALGGDAGAPGSAGANGGTSSAAGKAGNGDAGATAGGKAGSSVGGSAGSATAGSAGSSLGGSAGNGNAGSSGAGSGGIAGNASGGSAGNGASGNAGTSSGGNAGTSSGGNAGTSSGGNAGTSSGGNAGGPLAGSGGSSGGNAGGAAGAPTTGGAAGTNSGGNAGAGQGGAGLAGASGAGGSGAVNPTDCSVIYVSPAGALTNDGCSPSKPSINPLQGLGAAQANTTEMRICEGNYPGGITLARNLSIKGSYDCTTWTRGPLSPTAPLTKIISTSSSPALLVVSPTVTRETIIEGIHFQGNDGGSRSRALTISGGSPLVRLNLLEARSAKTTGSTGAPLSVGLSLENGAGPRVENNAIRSGNVDSTASVVASAGVMLDALVGPVELVGNRIRSGNATLYGKGYGTFGIYVEPPSTQAFTGVNAFRDNIVTSGNGRDATNMVEILSGGIFIDETSSAKGSFEIIGGSLTAGRAEHQGLSAPNTYPTAAGIFSGRHVSLKVDHVRIYGGDAPASTGTSMALNLGGTGSTTILTSALHGGGILADTPYPRALESRSSGSLTITASTLFSGIARSVGGSPAGGTGIYLSSPGRVVLENNFFVMHSSFVVGIQLSGACSAPEGSNLTGNAFGSIAAGHSLFEGEKTGSGACNVTQGTLPGLSARFPLSANNIRITPAPQHASELNLGCSTNADCLSKLLSGFTTEDALRESVISLADGSFAPKRCGLAKPTGVTSLTTTDLLGRAVPQASPSVGALQVETCQ